MSPSLLLSTTTLPRRRLSTQKNPVKDHWMTPSSSTSSKKGRSFALCVRRPSRLSADYDYDANTTFKIPKTRIKMSNGALVEHFFHNSHTIDSWLVLFLSLVDASDCSKQRRKILMVRSSSTSPKPLCNVDMTAVLLASSPATRNIQKGRIRSHGAFVEQLFQNNSRSDECLPSFPALRLVLGILKTNRCSRYGAVVEQPF